MIPEGWDPNAPEDVAPPGPGSPNDIGELPVGPARAGVPGVDQPSSVSQVPQQLPVQDETALLAAFLAGAGLERMPADMEPAAAMRTLGESSRVLVKALAEILQARRTLKHNFRIRQTVVESRGNNPLKFSPGEEDMLMVLLGKARPGFLTGARAVSEAAEDLVRHQRATIAGFQAVIEAIFVRLSPERIENAGKQRKGLLAGDSFKERYAGVYADLHEDYGELLSGKLGQIFAEAYEEHAPAGPRGEGHD